MKIKLGSKIRDGVSGLEGIATARVVYLNGCTQYCLAPAIKEGENSLPKGYYIDQGQLEFVDDEITQEAKETGGPQFYRPGR